MRLLRRLAGIHVLDQGPDGPCWCRPQLREVGYDLLVVHRDIRRRWLRKEKRT